MQRAITILAGLLLATFTAVFSNAMAQEKHAYTHASPPDSSKYLKDISIDVDDAPGHKIRIVEIQRTYGKDAPVLLGTKVIEVWVRAFTDYTNGNGPGHSYETWTLEDGSRVYLEGKFLTASEATASGSRKGQSYGTGRFVGGTGKFATLRGTITSTVDFDTDAKNGYSKPMAKGEYWLGN